MKKIFMPLLLAAFTLGTIACSDDDNVSDPAGTVALNMMNENNGKTLLGESGIYIDKAQNFVTGHDCYLFTLGKVSGLGAAEVKSLSNPVSQAALQYGYAYAAYRPGALIVFPSGKMALPIGNSGVNYMKFYVMSPLTEGDKVVGAAVKYALATPKTYGLPDFGSRVLSIDLNRYEHLGKEVMWTLPTADCEVDFDEGSGAIRCEKRGRKLVFGLEDWLESRSALCLRIRESYTKVYVETGYTL